MRDEMIYHDNDDDDDEALLKVKLAYNYINHIMLQKLPLVIERTPKLQLNSMRNFKQNP
jgi:hypothetical protein